MFIKSCWLNLPCRLLNRLWPGMKLPPFLWKWPICMLMFGAVKQLQGGLLFALPGKSAHTLCTTLYTVRSFWKYTFLLRWEDRYQSVLPVKRLERLESAGNCKPSSALRTELELLIEAVFLLGDGLSSQVQSPPSILTSVWMWWKTLTCCRFTDLMDLNLLPTSHFNISTGYR